MSITLNPRLHARQTFVPASPSTSHAVCTWFGHCLGDSCQSENDCDQDWVCSNQICSPCCETPSSSPSSTIASTTASAATASTASTATASIATASATVSSQTSSSSSSPTDTGSHKGLSTGSAVGISLGAVGILILGVALGFWIWFRWRKSRGSNSNRGGQGPHDGTSLLTENDHKVFYQQRGVPSELPGHSRPTEMPTFELAELEGNTVLKTKSRLSEATSEDGSDGVGTFVSQGSGTISKPKYRFEQYSLASDGHSEGERAFVPT